MHHHPLFLKHFEEKTTCNTVLLRLLGLTFTCPGKGQSIPGPNVLSQNKRNEYLGWDECWGRSPGCPVCCFHHSCKRRWVEMPPALSRHRTTKKGGENIIVSLEENVAIMGHSYDRGVQTPCLLSSPPSLGVHLDLAIAAPSPLVRVLWCTLWWDLGPPETTRPTAAVTM